MEAESPRKMSWILLSCLLEFAGHARAFGVMNGMCGIFWWEKSCMKSSL